jgi:hypothetical protein
MVEVGMGFSKIHKPHNFDYVFSPGGQNSLCMNNKPLKADIKSTKGKISGLLSRQDALPKLRNLMDPERKTCSLESVISKVDIELREGNDVIVLSPSEAKHGIAEIADYVLKQADLIMIDGDGNSHRFMKGTRIENLSFSEGRIRADRAMTSTPTVEFHAERLGCFAERKKDPNGEAALPIDPSYPETDACGHFDIIIASKIISAHLEESNVDFYVGERGEGNYFHFERGSTVSGIFVGSDGRCHTEYIMKGYSDPVDLFARRQKSGESVESMLFDAAQMPKYRKGTDDMACLHGLLLAGCLSQLPGHARLEVESIDADVRIFRRRPGTNEAREKLGYLEADGIMGEFRFYDDLCGAEYAFKNLEEAAAFLIEEYR